MNASYWGNVRSEIETLLPANATRILDIGCGEGATLAWLRSKYPNAVMIGIDGHAGVKPMLERNADQAFILTLPCDIPDVGRPDLMLFLDFLEHLPNPQHVLAEFVSRLAPGGTVIVSLPNVAHYSIALPLLRGQFEYRDSGILDRTYLRFFVQKSAMALMTGAGLGVPKALYIHMSRNARLVDRLTFGSMTKQLAPQLVMAGRQEDVGVTTVWSRARRRYRREGRRTRLDRT